VGLLKWLLEVTTQSLVITKLYLLLMGAPIDNGNSNGASQQSGRGGYDYGNAASDINP
jgi:hypothetical protein